MGKRQRVEASESSDSDSAGKPSSSKNKENVGSRKRKPMTKSIADAAMIKLKELMLNILQLKIEAEKDLALAKHQASLQAQESAQAAALKAQQSAQQAALELAKVTAISLVVLGLEALGVKLALPHSSARPCPVLFPFRCKLDVFDGT